LYIVGPILRLGPLLPNKLKLKLQLQFITDRFYGTVRAIGRVCIVFVCLCVRMITWNKWHFTLGITLRQMKCNLLKKLLWSTSNTCHKFNTRILSEWNKVILHFHANQGQKFHESVYSRLHRVYLAHDLPHFTNQGY